MGSSVHPAPLLIALSLLFLLSSLGAGEARAADIEMSDISGDPERPRRHFRLREAARLDPERAAEIYAIVRGALEKGYGHADIDAARDYQRWALYNTAPYRSATHGNHYVNNYANETGAAYARYEEAGRMPVGTIIAKDSFAVAETGGILLGPLFLMEKMPEGFNYLTGDWKYTLVGPDGTFFGETNGPGAERVEYCVSCHIAVEHHDHLYFVPKAYRLERGQ